MGNKRERLNAVPRRRATRRVGEEHNRIRRPASPPHIARKLMLLDFVVEHPGLDWYATEADKTALFVDRLGVPESALPRRTYHSVRPGPSTPGTTRYWVQKLPLFLHGTPPTVNFVCLVTDQRAGDIDTFVRDHAPLLKHLPRWSLNAVLPRHAATDQACTAAYHRALAATSIASISKDDLDWFTRTQRMVNAGDLRALAMSDLRRYRDLSAALSQRIDAFTAGPLHLHRPRHARSYA